MTNHTIFTLQFSIFKSETIQSFGSDICNGLITLNNELEEQINLKNESDQFYIFTKSKSQQNEEKTLTYENTNKLFQGRQKVFNEF